MHMGIAAAYIAVLSFQRLQYSSVRVLKLYLILLSLRYCWLLFDNNSEYGEYKAYYFLDIFGISVFLTNFGFCVAVFFHEMLTERQIRFKAF